MTLLYADTGTLRSRPEGPPMYDKWPLRPIIYEINTWVWLNELGRRCGHPIKIDSVPAEQWDAIESLRVDAVWLMGVWERSPEGIRISNADAGLRAEFSRTLPDFTTEDNVGSAYCVRRYEVDERLGGAQGLAVARKMLAERGMRLILDFVPNHVAPDHPWIYEHPEYFIQGTPDDVSKAPGAFFKKGEVVIARGRDPHLEPWPDVAQLNAFCPGMRREAARTLSSITQQCDGVRCDMAMLELNSVFEGTWRERAGTMPKEEYWTEVISAVRSDHPAFLFIAEAYWDLEWELQQLGFDYCYDKRLYDRLRQGSAESVRLHLTAGLDYQDRLLRFIENHDEQRAAAVFSKENESAAAVAVMTLPGAKLLNEGQLEGRRVRLPVFLARRPDEPVDLELQTFYRRLLAKLKESGICEGTWRLCECSGWPDNKSCLNLVSWCWRNGEVRHLIVVNLSGRRSQARIRLPWSDLKGDKWLLRDVLSGEMFRRDGDEIQDQGIYVDLPEWGYNVFEMSCPGSESDESAPGLPG